MTIDLQVLDQGRPFGHFLTNVSRSWFLYKRPFKIIFHGAVPFLKQQEYNNPSIGTVSSVYGKPSFAAWYALYCMSKAAVDQLTRCASGEAKLMCLMFAPGCNFSEGEFCLCSQPRIHLYIIYDYVRRARCGRDA
jgi:NAD(P)-dependent dehydrogenase (short-subunit alcohol dehydrogenase family)